MTALHEQAEKRYTEQEKRDEPSVTPRARAPSFGGKVTRNAGNAERYGTDGERYVGGVVTATPDGCAITPGHQIFALDPGPQETGWCLFDGAKVIDSGVHANHDVLQWVKHGQHCDFLAVEMIANMGMAVGATTFDTVRWIGRFQQAWHTPDAVKLVYRREVKSVICNNQQAKDPNIRQALIDLIGAPGTKKAPGPTYGVTSHAWSALAVAVTALERMGIKVDPQQRDLLPPARAQVSGLAA